MRAVCPGDLPALQGAVRGFSLLMGSRKRLLREITSLSPQGLCPILKAQGQALVPRLRPPVAE